MIRIPGAIFRWGLFVCIALGIAATTLDLVGVAVAVWPIALPAVLLVGAGIWLGLERWDKYDPAAPAPTLGERIRDRLIQTLLILVVVAIGVGAVVFIAHFLWTHKDFLVLTGVVVLFFVGVAFWPSKKKPAAEGAPPAPRRRAPPARPDNDPDNDIVQ